MPRIVQGGLQGWSGVINVTTGVHHVISSGITTTAVWTPPWPVGDLDRLFLLVDCSGAGGTPNLTIEYVVSPEYAADAVWYGDPNRNGRFLVTIPGLHTSPFIVPITSGGAHAIKAKVISLGISSAAVKVAWFRP